MIELPTKSEPVKVLQGDCREVLPTLEAGSFDSIVTDPPYPCIDRPYGYWTEAEWFALMDVVVPQCRRLLKPTGSAVFILQPNSEKVGRMRTWLLEFTLKWAKAWGWIQDAYWWNPVTLPSGGATSRGMLRGSVKECVWLGSPDCYRNQRAVLWGKGEWHRSEKAVARAGVERPPSGRTIDVRRTLAAAEQRGGVTPFNLIPLPNNHKGGSEAGDFGHSAGTPMDLCRWWIRYLTPPGGKALDPFCGSGTTLLAADAEGFEAVGIEKEEAYANICRERIAKVMDVGIFAGVA